MLFWRSSGARRPPGARESCVSHLLLAPARESCFFGEVLAPGARPAPASRVFHTYFWRRRGNHAFLAKFWRPAPARRPRVVCFTLTSGAGAGIMLFWRSSGARRPPGARESCVSHLLLAPARESCFFGEVLAPGARPAPASRVFHTYFWRRRGNHAFLAKFWRPAPARRPRVVC